MLGKQYGSCVGRNNNRSAKAQFRLPGIRITASTNSDDRSRLQSICRTEKLNFMLGRHSIESIDGYFDFIFLTKTGRPLMPSAVNDILYNIVDAYNTAEVLKAKREQKS